MWTAPQGSAAQVSVGPQESVFSVAHATLGHYFLVAQTDVMPKCRLLHRKCRLRHRDAWATRQCRPSESCATRKRISCATTDTCVSLTCGPNGSDTQVSVVPQKSVGCATGNVACATPQESTFLWRYRHLGVTSSLTCGPNGSDTQVPVVPQKSGGCATGSVAWATPQESAFLVAKPALGRHLLLPGTEVTPKCR